MEIMRVETSVVIDISKVPKIFVETIHRFSSSSRPSAGFSFTYADNFSGYALDKHGHFLCHYGVIFAFFCIPGRYLLASGRW